MERPELPPARLSVKDQAFPRFRRFGPITVMLDGIEQSHCFAYDCEAGWIDCYCTDAEGKILLDMAKAEAATQRLTGLVTVAWGRCDIRRDAEPGRSRD